MAGTSAEAHSDGIELVQQDHEQQSERRQRQRQQQGDGVWDTLPRADGGKDAWGFLTACFIVEAVIWGFPFAFGVFQEYYAHTAPFDRSAGGIASIGTTATGCMYFLAPVLAFILQRYPRLRQACMYTGLAILILSLVAASFCNSTAALIGTQGIMYAVGGLLLYFPAIQLLDDWFVVRKGQAFGIMWAGTGLAGAVMPFLLQWMLGRFGWRTTLRAWAVVVAVLMGSAIPFLRPRTPIPASSALRPIDFSYLAHLPFWLFAASVVLQGLGFFLPTLWLPIFATSIGLPSFAGPLALALYNLAACVGNLVQGWLCDRFHVTVAILIATLGSMVACFVLWGLTTSQPMLYLFAILWGVSAGGFGANWTGCVSAIRDSGHAGLEVGPFIAFMGAAKGVGAVISGPLSERLLQMQPWKGAGYVYGTNYGILVVFTGVCATLGGTAWVGRMLRLL
ncbi:putative MFS monocarboxylate transporter [Polychaeton citri CBS 116435]|uniref:MFS monocarboxylate transporter n=1 Tax=Polychaeton citri CBS 116435 TaxID=1314669 RepID=A0A9P4US90_9PEZI|nr:putative MFS monocarboxylate transporter [Polychaeton citri CBS 116435]